MEKMTLTQPMAFGRTAEIHPWGDGEVLKLFYEWFSREDIHYEQRIASAIAATGLPVPAVGEIVEMDGRTGLVYERFDGEPMNERLFKKPWLVFRYARRSAALHVDMHASCVLVAIPGQREKLAWKIEAAKSLPIALKQNLLSALQEMPEGDRLCHGDFHPGNILITRNGERIIDWIDATLGRPMADLARSTIILLGAADCQVRNPILKGFIRLYHGSYKRAYFRLRPGEEAEYLRWLPFVAAARLSEGMPELESWLVRYAKGLSR